MRRALTEADLVRMAIPKRHWTADWTVAKAQPYWSDVEPYLSDMDALMDDGVGVMLVGDNGRGKTALSCLILIEARRRGRTGLFFSAAGMKSAVFNKTPFDRDQLLWDRAKTVGLLVIDDMWKGAADTKGYSEDLFDELMRARGAAMLPTILTSNTSPKDAIALDAVRRSTIHLMIETTRIISISGDNMRKASS